MIILNLMRYVCGVFILWTGVLFSPSFAEDISCECPKLACDSCSVEQGITFYTEKCGPKESKVRSCARPTCIPIDKATVACPNPPKGDGAREPIVVNEPKTQVVDPGPQTAEAPSVGKVKVIRGSVSIVKANGERRVIANAGEIGENERIEAGKDSGALVQFDGGNKLHVHEDTAVEVKEYSNPQSERDRKALLRLIRGKIRSQVKQKYNSKTSYYKVQSKGAVAGVRGTDFVMTYDEKSGDKGIEVETRVETIGGRVLLASLDDRQVREILRGEGATYSGIVSDAGKDSVIDGALSPVYKIEPGRLKALERDSQVQLARFHRGKKADQPICGNPSGRFNQCQWKCLNNPSGESKCRTDMPSVVCQRSRCDGNGFWSDPSILTPGAGRGACSGTNVIVKDCDY